MDKFTLYKDLDRDKQQIRRPISCLYGTFLFCAGCLLAAVLSLEGKSIFIGAASLAFIYGLLSIRNDRLTYDEKGITVYSIWGKPFRKSWNEVLSIDVVEEPLISRTLSVGHVLRIKCTEKKGSPVAIYRFPYRHYVGIDDFLLFLRKRQT